MTSIVTLVRDLVSAKLWGISDRLQDKAGDVRLWEMHMLDRLPTPSAGVRLVSGLLSSAAFKVGPVCEVCDCWPCICRRHGEGCDMCHEDGGT